MDIAGLSLFILSVTLQNNGYHTVRSPSEKLGNIEYIMRNNIIFLYLWRYLWKLLIPSRRTLN